MSGWGVETVEGGVARRAAAERAPALTLAEPEALLDLGRGAMAASAGDGLGSEYRALTISNLYYRSLANTPAATQEYLRRLCSRSFRGGHWPMVGDPDGTAHEIASFFEPLMAAHRPA